MSEALGAMKSRSQIKREVVMQGGTIDDAYKIISESSDPLPLSPAYVAALKAHRWYEEVLTAPLREVVKRFPEDSLAALTALPDSYFESIGLNKPDVQSWRDRLRRELANERHPRSR